MVSAQSAANAIRGAKKIYKSYKPVIRTAKRVGKVVYNRRKDLYRAGKAVGKKVNLKTLKGAGRLGIETLKDVQRAIK